MALPPDKLISQGPEFVRRLTRRFTVDNNQIVKRQHRSSHLDDGYDKSDTKRARYMPSVAETLAIEHGIQGRVQGDRVYGKLAYDIASPYSNSYGKRGIKEGEGEVDANEETHFQDRLRFKHSEPHEVAIDTLVHVSISDQLFGAHLFFAAGHVDSGIMFVGYSDSLRKVAGRRLARWNNLSRAINSSKGDKDLDMVARAELIAGSIERTTGFRPEEIEEHNRLLSTRLRGSKSKDHPIRTILVG